MKGKSMNKRYPAYRDGLEAWTEGDIFTAPGGEVIEVLFTEEAGGEKLFFAELPGVPACAHGDTIEEAIEEAKEKRGEIEPLTDEEKEKYRAEDFKFSVRLFRKLTRACRAGCDEWLKQRGLDHSATMTLADFRSAGGGHWADVLEEKVR